MKKIGLLICCIVFLGGLFSCARNDGEMAEGDKEYWRKDIRKSEKVLANSTEHTIEEQGDAMTTMARAYHALGQNDKAIKLWYETIEEYDLARASVARAHCRLGEEFEDLKMWDKAIGHYQKYVKIYPSLTGQEQRFFPANENDDAIAFHIGAIYEHRLQDIEKAEQVYLDVIENVIHFNKPFQKRLFELLGNFYVRQNKFNEAIVWYKKSLKKLQEAKPRWSNLEADMYQKIIACLKGQKRDKEAKKEFDKLLEEWGDTKNPDTINYINKSRRLIEQMQVHAND